MKRFFSFFISKKFFLHLLIAVGLLIVVCWLLINSLSSYTSHGETVEVPDFKQKSKLELDAFVKDKGVRYVIIDSIYEPKEKPGIVLRQEPEAKSLVKHNRTVYLYVTSMLPPQISMPKLVDRSVRQAVSMAESYGLKIAKINTVSAECNGCVLKQFYKGKEIAAGMPIKKGSSISLTIGKKEAGALVNVPNVLGLTLKEAIQQITSMSLNIGAKVFDAGIKDSLSAYVYKQSPNGNVQNFIGIGGSVDLYLTTDKEKIKTVSDDDDQEFDK